MDWDKRDTPSGSRSAHTSKIAPSDSTTTVTRQDGRRSTPCWTRQATSKRRRSATTTRYRKPISLMWLSTLTRPSLGGSMSASAAAPTSLLRRDRQQGRGTPTATVFARLPGKARQYPTGASNQLTLPTSSTRENGILFPGSRPPPTRPPTTHLAALGAATRHGELSCKQEGRWVALFDEWEKE
ncbi:hypothetical protein GGTG_13591 [Gaeumannomyces tritici R3-111a-1]|uniref:Uncharacterized protein n=1 Tax=Gaeumannomyces tritici (strain R3-111a-1) TaxID=644352 RepID=J3PJB0_GAET3|nr:hypothetical protein GGTG_13591 [Gaeumannomyces tritici R3-111a-1]EJT68838.1 hypothetical protein GGTG_13591 [Gaeumannomyces tritici R3-111a-1]